MRIWFRRRSRRTRRWLVVPTVLVVAAVAATGLWTMTRDEAATAAITTATVATETVQETVAASGTVQPARSVDLDFAVSGTVARVYVSEGDRVRKGDLLARIDDTVLAAARVAAEASVNAAAAQLAESQDAGASDTQIAADQTSLVAAQAALAEAEQAVDDTALRATIGGTVVGAELAVGDVVGAGSGGSSGSGAGSPTSTSSTTGTESTAAVSIVSTRRFVVAATVAGSDVARLSTGLQAQVTVTGVEETVYGTVSSVGLVAETSSSGAAVFPVTIDVTGTRDDLYAGSAAEASVIVKQTEGVLTVASRALSTEDGSTYVDKVVGDRTVRTEVETGTAYGTSTEILSGLSEGDVVELPGLTTPGGGRREGGQEEGDFPGGQFPGGPFSGGQAPSGQGPGGGGGFPGGGQ